MNNQPFILRERFTKKNKSRATIIGVIDNGLLKISGAKCKAKDFTRRDGVKYAMERLQNSEPWVTIPLDSTTREYAGSIFGAIARKVLKNLESYYQANQVKVEA